MPPDDVAADLAAMGPWNFLFLRSCEAEVAHKAGQLTDLEYAQVEIFYAHLLGAARDDQTTIELDADELGIELRAVRDTFARAQKKQQRLGRGRGPNRRPARREARRRRNVRTRRAKARAPGSRSSDDDPHHHLEPLAPAVHCWAHELRRLGARRAAA